jgi:hypothetical protein
VGGGGGGGNRERKPRKIEIREIGLKLFIRVTGHYVQSIFHHWLRNFQRTPLTVNSEPWRRSINKTHRSAGLRSTLFRAKEIRGAEGLSVGGGKDGNASALWTIGRKSSLAGLGGARREPLNLIPLLEGGRVEKRERRFPRRYVRPRVNDSEGI